MALAPRSPLLAFAIALTLASAGAAQSSDEALLREGVDLRAQGRDVEAFARFREAWMIAPSPRARAQMGWAAQALGRWREAEQMLREAAAAQGDAWIESNRAELARSLADVSARLGDLMVECEVAGAELSVDGEVVGALPLATPLRVPIGAVTIRVAAEGYLAVTREGVRVRAGVVAREHISLTAAPTPLTHRDTATVAATPTAPTVVVLPVQSGAGAAPRGSSLAPIGIAMFAVGAAGATTSVLGFALREAAVDRYSEGVREGICVGSDLPAASETNARCYDERSTIETWGALRWVGLGVGALGVAAGVTLFALDGRRAEARAFACGPWTDALGATCGARF